MALRVGALSDNARSSPKADDRAFTHPAMPHGENIRCLRSCVMYSSEQIDRKLFISPVKFLGLSELIAKG